jgi:hypothetical protein
MPQRRPSDDLDVISYGDDELPPEDGPPKIPERQPSMEDDTVILPSSDDEPVQDPEVEKKPKKSKSHSEDAEKKKKKKKKKDKSVSETGESGTSSDDSKKKKKKKKSKKGERGD